MDTDYWKRSPFGEESIFHPSWEEKRAEAREEKLTVGRINDLPNVYLANGSTRIAIGEETILTLKVEGISKKDIGGRYSIELKYPKTVVLSNNTFQAEKGWSLKTRITTKAPGKINIQVFVDGVRKNTLEVESYDPNCICSKDWTTISPIISKSGFVGWGYPGVNENCFDYAWKELIEAGYSLISPSWQDRNSTSPKISPGIIQTYVSIFVAGMSAGAQKDMFVQGVKYLKESMINNIPVMVGVDDDPQKSSNPDKTTDHFVIIVGMGSDEKGNYFLFHDNAISDIEIGTSVENKLYCDCDNFVIKGCADKRNTYAAKHKYYLVTQIRKSKLK